MGGVEGGLSAQPHILNLVVLRGVLLPFVPADCARPAPGPRAVAEERFAAFLHLHAGTSLWFCG